MPDNAEFRENLDEAIIALLVLLSANVQDEIDVAAAIISKDIRRMQRSGMETPEIVAVLEADILAGGGRFFGQLKNAVKSQLNLGITEAASIGKNLFLESEGVDSSLLKWRVTQSSTGPCQDCGPRAGQVRTREEWEIAGLPRSGFSVCRSDCLCDLDPIGVETPDTVTVE